MAEKREVYWTATGGGHHRFLSWSPYCTDAFNKINAFIFMSLLFNHIPQGAQAGRK